ncbi:MAG: hypothetical protein AAF810_24050 [Cyanobacteria bacterium P01_D01_bin.36]
MKIVRLMCLALLLLLTSCSLLPQTPPDAAVELAIAHHLSQTQHSLAQDLGILNEQTATKLKPNFTIDNIAVKSRQKVTNSSLSTEQALGSRIGEIYKVRGSFDATLTAKDFQKKQKNSTFEVLLGRNATETEENSGSVQTWYLIEP